MMDAGEITEEIIDWDERDAARFEMQMALDGVRVFLKDYVVFSSKHELNATTLWVAHTWLYDAFETSPRLVVRSPSKGTGKSRLLECLNWLVREPVLSAGMTASVVYRLIDNMHPTLLQDEADTVFAKSQMEANEILRAVYNSGWRASGVIWRSIRDGADWTPVGFNVYSPVALACIGDMPDTIMDRALVINMHRKTEDEHVKKFRTRIIQGRADEVKAHLSAATEYARAWIDDAEPEDMSQDATDRQLDLWEPLVLIADVAGGDWPTRARKAMAAMTTAQAIDDAATTPNLELLADLRRVWPKDEKYAATMDLVADLRQLDEAPWGAVDYGQPALDARVMAKLLRPYHIRAVSFWEGKQSEGGKLRRGYDIRNVADAWKRYLPDDDKMGDG